MRVLLVNQRYPPDGAGAEVYTAALARELAARHDVAVLYGRDAPDVAEGELRRQGRDDQEAYVVGVPASGGFEAYRNPRVALAAARLMDSWRPDVLHAGNLAGLSTGIVFAARDRGIPVVVTLHDFWPVCPLGQLLTRRLDVCPGPTPSRCLGCVGEQVVVRHARLRAAGRRLPSLEPLGRMLARADRRASSRIAARMKEMAELLRAADVLVAPSRFLARRMHELGAPEVLHVPLGTHRAEGAARLHARLGQAPRLRFGYVGAVIPSKGVHILVDAYQRMATSRASLRIHGPAPAYHGDTGYEVRLRTMLGAQADDVLRGPFASGAAAEIFASLDVVVVPSLWEENSPLVVLEAFRAGCPVVASNHGGLAEMIADEVNGLLFAPGDATALERAMRRLNDEVGLYDRLAEQVPSVPSMGDHVRRMEEIYVRARERAHARAGRVGVVILDHDRPLETAGAESSIRETFPQARVVVVENGLGGSARPGSIRLSENRGFAAGVNAGMKHLIDLGCDRVLLLNNDATVEPGCVRRLAERLEDGGWAAVGPVIQRATDGRIESAGMHVDLLSGHIRLRESGAPPPEGEACCEVEALSGAVLMLSRAAIERVGFLDEGYFFSFEDVDWCLRARAHGLRLGVLAGARARHVGSLTIGRASPQRLYYAARNHVRLVERLRPLPRMAQGVRRLAILALNLVHALGQNEVSRPAAVAAIVAGLRDAYRGRYGPRS